MRSAEEHYVHRLKCALEQSVFQTSFCCEKRWRLIRVLLLRFNTARRGEMSLSLAERWTSWAHFSLAHTYSTHNQPFTASEKEQRKTSSIHFPLLVCVHGCIQHMRERTREWTTSRSRAHWKWNVSLYTLCDGIARIRHFSALHQALNIPSSARLYALLCARGFVVGGTRYLKDVLLNIFKNLLNGILILM
jgi:hypothetical protein